MISRKEHWEKVYNTKQAHEVSWTQDKPNTSLRLIQSLNLNKEEAIIDIGGGDSKLVDFLLAEGYQNLTVLDISGAAIQKAKKRLGNLAEKVQWVETDILEFKPSQNYAVWHDRAAFHFLRNQEDIALYQALTNQFVSKYLVLATFSEQGPTRCSALDITQYSEEKIHSLFGEQFKILEAFQENHTTPFNTSQNFLFVKMVRS